MSDTEQFYRDAIRRVYRNLIAIAVLGAVAAAIHSGYLFGLGFLAGAAGALATFGWFHHLAGGLTVAATGQTAAPPSPSKRAIAWALGMRYLLLGAVAYGMLNYLGINPKAFLLGLLILAPAVLLEILTEIIFYART